MIYFNQPLTIPEKYIKQNALPNWVKGSDITLEGFKIRGERKIEMVIFDGEEYV